MQYHHGLALAFVLASLGATSAVAATVAATVEARDRGMAGEAVSNMSAVAVISMTSAVAASDPDNPEVNDWDVSFTPYLWVAGTKGDIGIPRGEGVEVDKSFADVLGNLKFAFMGALDVRHGRVIAITDIMYLSVGAEAEGIRDPQFLEGEIDTSVFLGTAAVGYRVVDKGPLFVDLFAGGRLASLKAKVELTGPLQTRERKESATKVSALVGGRVRVPLGKSWGLALYSDVGSGAVKWQAIGTAQYDISRHWRLAAGYRHMSINYSKRDLDIDIALSGPIVGVTYKF